MAGFYGIYFGVVQFFALIWRRAFVYDRWFSGTSGELLMWFLSYFPFWLFCIVSGFVIPYVIESQRRYAWAIVLGSLFLLNSLLFTSVHYAEGFRILDIVKYCINIFSPIVLCALGTFLHYKYINGKPEQQL